MTRTPHNQVEPPPAGTTPAATTPLRQPSLPPLENVLAVAAGGAVGGSLRYGFIQVFPVVPGAFPWVIFLENLTGAFLLGLILTLVLDRWRFKWDVRPFLTTGILGSFTTFSNFTFDIVNLGWGGWYVTAALYSFASMALGIISALFGVKLGHVLAGGKG